MANKDERPAIVAGLVILAILLAVGTPFIILLWRWVLGV
jgi:hypothetical protein